MGPKISIFLSAIFFAKVFIRKEVIDIKSKLVRERTSTRRILIEHFFIPGVYGPIDGESLPELK